MRYMYHVIGQLTICHYNWKSITFICMIMASKVWDDLSMWNADFAKVSSLFDLETGMCTGGKLYIYL